MPETNPRPPLTGWMWVVLITGPLGFLSPALAAVIQGATVNTVSLSGLPLWFVLPLFISQNPDDRRRHRVLGWGGVVMGVVLGAFALLFWLGRPSSEDAQLRLLTSALLLSCTLVLLVAGAMLLRRSATLPPPDLPL